MARVVPVRAGDSEFLIEVVERGGPADIGITGLLDFDTLVETVRDIGSRLGAAWEGVRPTEATVEIGVEATVKEGRLTGLLVSGGGKGTMTVTLTWKFD